MAGNPIKKGHAIAALVIGGLECLFALIVVICSFVMAGKAKLPSTLTPYWAAIPFFIPGIIGVVTGFTKNRCAMIASMVLNIICLVLNSVGTILILIVMAFWAAIAGVVKDKMQDCKTQNGNCVCKVNGKDETVNNVDDCNTINTIIALMYVIIALLVISLILALAGSIVGCASVCCTGGTQPATVIVQQQAVPVAYTNNPAGVATIQPQQEAPPGYAEKY